MEFRDVIARRYSCRKFDGKAVEAEKLNAVLEAGRLAPTARNPQEQRVYVLKSLSALTVSCHAVMALLLFSWSHMIRLAVVKKALA